MNYLPHTDAERQQMLEAIGVASMDELYRAIPPQLKGRSLDIPEGRSELEVQAHLAELAAKNRSTSQFASFLGAGSYRRYLPTAVDWILHRSEFLTAYTPYQPEVSQGTLQVIFEFQTMLCELTGMDAANASMYDGSTAAAEAAFMACRITRRSKVLVLDTVHPEYREVLETYSDGPGVEVVIVPHSAGKADPDRLPIDQATACVLIQVPNFFGGLEDVRAIASQIHEAGGLLVVVAEPVSLGLLEAPGAYGADVVVGEAQPFGNTMSFGGPYVGYMACREKHLRQLPGRIAGATTDAAGTRVFTLTLQTREQHIRREKATSNICTNQALNALAATVYMTVVGKRGIRELAHISLQRAHSLSRAIAAIPGFSIPFGAHFNEFVMKSPMPASELLAKLKGRGILGGVDLSRWWPELSDHVLVCVTETNSPAELERYVTELKTLAPAAARA